MKKLLGILVLGLFLSSNAYAEVWYCSEIGHTGFNPDGSGGYKQVKFVTKKFKAKIDFEKKYFESKDIDFEMYGSEGVCIEGFAMTCSNNIGDSIYLSPTDIHEENRLNFVLAYMYGWAGKKTNPISISYGTCEKF